MNATNHTAHPAADARRSGSPSRERRRSGALLLSCAVALAAACDRRPESNGGPRLESLHSERAPYPLVGDLPASSEAVSASAAQFVMVERDEIVRLGARGIAATSDVSLDELLRAFWRLRGDTLGGRGAASPSAAPLVIAGAAVPAARVIEVVAALWHHGAHLAVGGGLPGAARQHSVRLVADQAKAPRAAHGALVELGPRGLALTMPGEKSRSFDGCGQSPDTACLARVLDAAAQSGARAAILRRTE